MLETGTISHYRLDFYPKPPLGQTGGYTYRRFQDGRVKLRIAIRSLTAIRSLPHGKLRIAKLRSRTLSTGKLKIVCYKSSDWLKQDIDLISLVKLGIAIWSLTGRIWADNYSAFTPGLIRPGTRRLLFGD